jgi:hypothetical protein
VEPAPSIPREEAGAVALSQKLEAGLSKEPAVVAAKRLPQEAKAPPQTTGDANRSPVVWLHRADLPADWAN